MRIVIVTGSTGLIGSEAALFFRQKGFHIVGIDNDMRRYFFGSEGSTNKNKIRLENEIPDYEHYDYDIRDFNALEKVFDKYRSDTALVITLPPSPPTIGRLRSRLPIFRLTPTERLICLKPRGNIVRRRFLFLPARIKFTETDRIAYLLLN